MSAARSILAILLPLAAACAAPLPPVYDAHVHLNDEPMQLATMDAHGIGRAVIFWGRLSDNATILEAASRHPERFVPFASVSPERSAYRAQWQRDDPAIVAELEALMATNRYKGIGEISVVHAATPGFAATDFSPLSPTMRGILEVARKYRVPVMVHCEVSRASELERLLELYRDVTVIWAHGGYTQAREARERLERHPNLVYELSARTWPRHPRSADYPIVRDGAISPEWLALVEEMSSRFIVGTDASHRDEAAERMKAESVTAFLEQLSPRAARAIGSDNLRRLVP